MSVPAIDINGVWFSYDKTPILEDVTLTLKQGVLFRDHRAGTGGGRQHSLNSS